MKTRARLTFSHFSSLFLSLTTNSLSSLVLLFRGYLTDCFFFKLFSRIHNRRRMMVWGKSAFKLETFFSYSLNFGIISILSRSLARPFFTINLSFLRSRTVFCKCFCCCCCYFASDLRTKRTRTLRSELWLFS